MNCNCASLFEKYSRRQKIYSYTVPVSPRLNGTIFNMSKHELIDYLNKNDESNIVKSYVLDMDDSRNLLEMYSNLQNEHLTVGRRIVIKKWLESHGAEFYSLCILPEYQCVCKIGAGSFSKAYLIKNKYNNNHTVFKLTKSKIRNLDCKYFIREVEILKSICHPHIIKLHDYNIINENIFWCLNEYCNLGSVDKYIKEVDVIELYYRIRILHHIASALSYIHERNIIHRDVKPANIFICGKSYFDDKIVFKLGDFNLSRTIGISHTSKKPICESKPSKFKCESVSSNHLSYCGTPNYMAPEVINKQCYSTKIDVWGLLCVLLEVIFNRNVNPINIIPDELESMLNSDKIQRECSELEHVIIKMMHHTDPEKRHNILEVKICLENMMYVAC